MQFTADPSGLMLILVTNLPLVVAFLIALNKKLLYTGASIREKDEYANRMLAQKQDEVEFREQLRDEALKDKRAIEERSAKQAEALKELTDVVRQQLDFSERLISSAPFGPEWNRYAGSKRPRARTRNSSGDNPDS